MADLEKSGHRVESLQAALAESKEENQRLQVAIDDAMAGLGDSTALCESLQAQLTAAEAELASLREEIEASDANMQAAARAGLTLTEMLAKMKVA